MEREKKINQEITDLAGGLINGILLHFAYCVLHTLLLNMEKNVIKDLATVLVVVVVTVSQ